MGAVRVGVLGLGLIGGSVARRLAPDHDVRGWDPDPATRAAAAAAGLALAADLGRPDVAILATPMSALPAALDQVARGLPPADAGDGAGPDPGTRDGGPTVTDVGSVRPTVTDIGSVRPTETDIRSVRPTVTDVGSVRPTETDIRSVRPTETDIRSVRPTVTDVGSVRPTVTDVGSVKGPVLAAARAAGLADRYVGGHPMAGSERAGFAAADPALLDGAVWVLCLEEDTDLDRWLAVAELVAGTGCRVLPTTAAAHDEAQARISGLPHLLASALAAAGGRGGPLAAALSAGSFRDGTRVAGSRAEFVAALCDGNRAALAAVLDETLAELAGARDALRSGGTVLPLATAGHAARRARDDAPPAKAVRLERSAPDLRAELLALGATGGWLDAVTPDHLHGRRPAG